MSELDRLLEACKELSAQFRRASLGTDEGQIAGLRVVQAYDAFAESEDVWDLRGDIPIDNGPPTVGGIRPGPGTDHTQA